MKKFLAALAISGLVVASCGGDDSDSSDRSISGEDAPRPDAGQRTDDAEDYLSDEPTADTTAPADSTASPQVDAQQRTDADAEGELATDTSRSNVDDAETTIEDGGEDGGLFGPEDPADDDGSFEDGRFAEYGYREFIPTARDPLSTFALDVDTGAFTIGRRSLESDALPPRASVRPEEYVNAFDYDYVAPQDGLAVSVDGGPSPFAQDNFLVRIGVQAEVVADEDRGPAALTFVIDTSGSMDRPDRLGLVKESLTLLVEELDRNGHRDDTVAIVTYSDDSGIVLQPTPVSERRTIVQAIDDIGPGGSTNLEAGLREGYALAREAFNDDGINRVIVASDGIANAGQTDPDALAAMIREDADRGINLVTIGYGMDGFNDVMMEQLADQGDGFYAYVDTRDEAERLFEDELTSTLLTIAKDAKIQVEFDDELVEAYRLIGFENRAVRDEDFRNDAVDAGELGAGHQVTAIYEIELADGVGVDDGGELGPLGSVMLRWEDPDSGEITEIDDDIELRDIEDRWADTTVDFQLATVVATLAEKLRDNPYADDVDLDDLADEAARLADDMRNDDIDDLADLVAIAARLS